MRRGNPATQTVEAVKKLRGVGFERRDFKVRSSNGRGEYDYAVVTFLCRATKIMLYVDEMAEAGFKVTEYVVGGKVVNVSATMVYSGGSVNVLDLDEQRAAIKRTLGG